MKEMFDFYKKELCEKHSLPQEGYEWLIQHYSPVYAAELAKEAICFREAVYGRDVYIRGLIEISNYCRNDCLYCGIRRSNQGCERYRLSEEEILNCCREGYGLGFRTFVLQGGEDAFYHDEVLCKIIFCIKEEFPDCAVTLSLGERSRESYQRLYDAGADRYLLRHETADEKHYALLHPKELTLDNRKKCLWNLKEIGYQTGCGFMVGSPGQTVQTLAKDLKWIEEFEPDMCGIGPFIPHHATPFAQEPAGTLEMTCYLLSIIRLIKPDILLPSTTALGTIHPKGREQGILSGANVVMPNLSPAGVRSKYELYNDKISNGVEAAQNRKDLELRMETIGYRVVTHRGDRKKQ